mmetsp:Transcript_32281/g.40477  ORF Transcript_32281/g.40477 Transcript_32281/m.40477 type:complete len:345 (+) Transcript_32281:258-1292(+)
MAEMSCDSIIWGSHGTPKIDLDGSFYCECDPHFYPTNENNDFMCVNKAARNSICMAALILNTLLLCRIILKLALVTKSITTLPRSLEIWTNPKIYITCYSFVQVIFWFKVAVGGQHYADLMPAVSVIGTCVLISLSELAAKMYSALPHSVLISDSSVNRIARSLKSISSRKLLPKLLISIMLLQIGVHFLLAPNISRQICFLTAGFGAGLTIIFSAPQSFLLLDEVNSNLEANNVYIERDDMKIFRMKLRIFFGNFVGTCLATGSLLGLGFFPLLRDHPVIFLYIPLGILSCFRANSIVTLIFPKSCARIPAVAPVPILCSRDAEEGDNSNRVIIISRLAPPSD